MHSPKPTRPGVSLVFLVAVCVAPILIPPVPARAQINDQLSAYTGRNAEGYLQPLADAFGASLNDGFFYSARIPRLGFHLSLEVPVMGVIFDSDAKYFLATTEGGFQPETTTKVPTVVGPGDAVLIPGQGGTSYAFPGGLDLHSFGLFVPQLRLSALFGTEALFRWIAIPKSGDSELGDVTLYGIGVRHSVSQYLPVLPVEMAAGFMWQSFSVGQNNAGDNLISANAFTFGLQASKPIALGPVFGFEPYAGLSFDTFSMDVKYESDIGGTKQNIDLSFDTSTTAHFTIGAGFNFLVGHVHGEYNFANQSSFSFGLALGNGF